MHDKTVNFGEQYCPGKDCSVSRNRNKSRT